MSLEDISVSQPREKEVLLKIAACGVCHTDLHVMKGEVRFPTPAVLGHEVSGVVEAVGPGVTHVKAGDRVVSSFIMPCGECEYCAKGREDLCATFFSYNRLKGQLYDGSTRLARKDGSPLWMYSMGGLAEYAVTPATSVFKAPEGVSLQEAAIIGCSVFTAYGAVKHQAALRAGETVAVFAVGGVGTNAIQAARAFGAAEIIAIDVRDEKLEMAKSFGATATVNAAREDASRRVMELTGGKGVDVAIEALGLPQTVLQAFESVKDGGRVVLIGIAPGGTTVPLEITRIVRRGVTVIGSYGARARSDMPDIVRMVQRGMLDVQKPVTRRYALDQVNEAYAALNRGEITGRAIITMSN
jgi:S-(hydroxymethyl)glutathione dehydrogenase/alcohol dehydrogenase